MINLYDLLEAASGQLFGEPSTQLFTEFSTDSRNPVSGSMFVALKTERGDGHQYMKEAVQRGATGLLCSRPPEFDTAGISVVLVKNPVQALMQWSHFVIGKQGLQVVGVAGTAGKSVALAALERVLSLRFRVLSATATQGGRLDIPMTLARLTPEHQIVALALDAQHIGEMADMVSAVRPHVAVVTQLGQVQGMAAEHPALREEIHHLIDYLSPNGLAVLNYDDDDVRALVPMCRARTSTVSTEVDFGADLIAQNINLDAARTGFDLRVGDQRMLGKWTPMLGKAHLMCVLEAVAVGLYYDIPAADSLRALTELEPLPGRMRPLIGVNGALLIDDTYKADTWSSFAALDWLQTVVKRDGGRAIFVLGDMDIIGSQGQRGHRRVGQRASEFADVIITLGAESSLAARAALDQGVEPARVRTTYSTHDAVQNVLSLDLKPNDLVLLKGGAAARMDLVTRALLHDQGDAVQLTHTEEMAALSLISKPNRPTWIEVDRDALAHNVRRLKGFVGAGVTLFAVVKADAYGHGAVGVARTALQNGAEYLAVANIHEAIDLRDSGITAPILLMSYLPPEMARQAVQYDITATIYDLEIARLYDAAARDQAGKLKVHVKIDTGMGRLGILSDKAISLFRNMTKLAHLEVEGVYTHFSTADDFDGSYVAEQGKRFKDILVPLRASGFQIRYVHACNSAGTLRGADFHFNAVRCGIAMYGLSPSDEVPVPADFKPVMTWKTIVAQVKTLPPRHPVGYGNTYITSAEERVAVLPLGFADGFRRAPGKAQHVLIHGQFAPLLGRVSMEKTVVSVQEIPDVNIGDEVVILGAQGENRISPDDLAEAWGTSNYEVVTSALARVPRK